MSKLKEYSRHIIFVLVLAAVMTVYGLRLADWQILNGSSWLETANKSTSAQVTMDAARGEILDVNGLSLAVNKTGYAIVFDKAYMPNGTANKTIAQLISLLTQRGEKWTDILPIKLNAKGRTSLSPEKKKRFLTLKSKDYLHMNPYATADECMTELVKNMKSRVIHPLKPATLFRCATI